MPEKVHNMFILSTAVFLYFLACITVGFFGRQTKVGGLGTCLIALICTPVVAGIMLMALTPKKKPSGGTIKKGSVSE